MSGFPPSVKIRCSITLLLLVLFTTTLVAQVRSTRAGSWIQGNTWVGGVVPGLNDAVLKDVIILNDSVVIPAGSTVEINNLTIDGGGKLVVNGTLIIHQNVLMTNNSVGYAMGPSAAVIIYGNFEIKNQVKISLSSFLVVYGDFIKSGSSNQGDVAINDGNIYVLGEVSGNGWPTDFGCTTNDYSGNTPNESEDCDYGNEQDFEENQENFPDELVDLINCYDLSSVSATPTCSGGSSTLSINNPGLLNVNFEWQEKNIDSWRRIGSSFSVSLQNIQDFQKEYRLIVRPSGTAACKISISRNIKIPQLQELTWTGATDTNWNNPANWSCNSLPTLQTNVLIPAGVSRYPLISNGDNALAKDVTIKAGASIEVSNNRLRIAGNLSGPGRINAGTGTISFEGNTRQTIPANTFVNGTILNLNIKNPGGVSSQEKIQIINSLKVEEGIFETGDDLLLVSNASGTAFIDGSGNGNISGTVSMQRYLANAFGYKYFSTPFQNTSVAELETNFDLTDPKTGFPHLYQYVEGRKDASGNDLTGWQKYLEPTASLNAGAGYAINPAGENAPLTLELTGEVNSGPVNIELYNNEGYYTNGFNLVGNPYPSPIDLTSLNLAAGGLDNAFYFFNAGSQDRYTGTYSSIVNGVSTGTNTTIIPSMQGFFVRVSNPGNATLSFTNAARTGNQVAQNFYRSKNNRTIPQIKLTAGFSGETASDAAVIYFQSGATTGFEKDWDALKLMNTATEVPSLYSLTERQEKLSINAIDPSEKKEIPLGIKTERSGKMFINLEDVQNIFPSKNIYLKDLKNHLIYDLSEESTYFFTSQKGEINDRFMLLLTSEKLSENELRAEQGFFTVNSNEGEIRVKLNLDEHTSGNVILTNLSGQILQKKPVQGKEEIKFEGIPAPGIYLVSLEFQKKKFTKKILLKK